MIYSVLYFDLEELSTLFGGAKPTKPPVEMGLTWSSGIDVFSSHQQSSVENVKRYLKTWLKIYFYQWR